MDYNEEDFSNRWEYARQTRGLEDKPIGNSFKYKGNIKIDFNSIYDDLADNQDWERIDWYKWNWRVPAQAEQWPFPQNSSTQYVSKNSILFSQLRLKEYEPLNGVLEELNIEMPYDDPDLHPGYTAITINRQFPGDMLWMHYDCYTDHEWEKYIMFLNDWGPGQVFLVGDKALTNWKSGDVYWVDVLSTPHGTCNCGPEERWTATFKGKPKK
jgi:hypothetical protein